MKSADLETAKTTNAVEDVKKAERSMPPRLQLVLMYVAFFVILGIVDRLLSFILPF